MEEARQLRRALPVERRADHRHVVELGAGGDLPEEQAAPAHVAAPGEGCREQEAGAQPRCQERDVLRRGDASQQYEGLTSA